MLKKYWCQLQEVFIDRASASTVYPGIDLQGVQSMCAEWNLGAYSSGTRVGSAFDLVSKDEFEPKNELNALPSSSSGSYDGSDGFA